jgi:N6-adenosine-specific RNA methylase IME4
MNILFPNIEYSKKQDGNKGYDITSDGEIICRIYKKGNVNELFIRENTLETIIDFIPQVSKKPRLLSKLISSFINEKTGLEIFSVEFWMLDNDSNLMIRYNYKQ